MNNLYSGTLNRRLFLGATSALAASLAMPRIARAANTKAIIAYTGTAAAAGLFNAQAQGFFAQHGLDTELLMQGNSVGVVAAVQSGAAQIGAAAAGVFAGAVEHGLDYVALGCQSLFGPGTKVLAVLARKGSDIKTAKDFEGKKVAVPGISGGTHIMFLQWVKEKGGDEKKIQFVEAKYAQHADILRGTTVDALVTSEPYLSRITAAGLGTVVSNLDDTAVNIPDAFFMTTRAWADAHPDAMKGFQQALAEGVAFAKSDRSKSDENTAKFLKQNIDIVKASGDQNFCDADLTKHVNELNTVMIGLGLTKTPLDPNVIVWKPGV